MGYETQFEGEFFVTPYLTRNHVAYLQAFSKTRHMRRRVSALKTAPDPIRKAAGLPLGKGGEFYVGSDEEYSSYSSRENVIDFNTPPATQPGLWCKWEPTFDGDAIVWSGAEKFYDYVEWLEYLIVNFLEPWGYTVNGTVEWTGEDRDDLGRITVTDNVMKAQKAVITYVDYES